MGSGKAGIEFDLAPLLIEQYIIAPVERRCVGAGEESWYWIWALKGYAGCFGEIEIRSCDVLALCGKEGQGNGYRALRMIYSYLQGRGGG